MNKKLFGLIATFAGFAANAVSALNTPLSRYAPDEVERLRERLMSNAQNNGAVLLLPKLTKPNGHFLWLAAHGSHVSHASHSSHASHVSHASGSSSPRSPSQSYVPPYYNSPWYNASPALPIQVTVIKDVNFRTGPGTTNPIIMVLHPNQKLSVIGSSGSWVKANILIKGVIKTGWLSAECIK